MKYRTLGRTGIQVRLAAGVRRSSRDGGHPDAPGSHHGQSVAAGLAREYETALVRVRHQVRVAVIS
jgi:hypothetical protein